MAAHLLDVTFHHVHAHAATGNIRHLLGGGEARRKNQHAHFFIGHVFVDRHPLRDSFRQNALAIQPRAVIGHFNADIAALVFSGEDQITDSILPGFKACFRHLDTVIEAIAHQVG